MNEWTLIKTCIFPLWLYSRCVCIWTSLDENSTREEEERPTFQFTSFIYQPVPSMCFPAVEKDRHMCACFRYFKSFSQLYYILTSNVVVLLAYAVGGIDDDTDIKMFFARFWRRRLWSWTFKKMTNWQIETWWTEDTSIRKQTTHAMDRVWSELLKPSYIICQYQSGFRATHATVTALLDATDT